MKTQTIAANIDSGTIYYTNRSEESADLQWAEHPNFKGVYLKHLIKGGDTDGRFSSHLVRIDPDCCLETHCHENQLELHEIIEGEGVFSPQPGGVRVSSRENGGYPHGGKSSGSGGKTGIDDTGQIFPCINVRACLR